MRAALPAALPAAALALLALLPALLPALAPAAAATHGASYVARGVAVGGGQVLLAEVGWTGAATQRFHVALSDPATGALVAQRTFAGDEATTGTAVLGAGAFAYRGWSVDPGVDFEVEGPLATAAAAEARALGLTGHFGTFTLALAA